VGCVVSSSASLVLSVAGPLNLHPHQESRTASWALLCEPSHGAQAHIRANEPRWKVADAGKWTLSLRLCGYLGHLELKVGAIEVPRPLGAE
jgi:hypothetical protein